MGILNENAIIGASQPSGYSVPDANTLLLIHSDDDDESTSFTDTSQTGHSITANGAAKHDTAQAKFGGSSIYFGGASAGADYLSLADHDHWDIGDNFTIDYWIYFTSFPNDYMHMIGRATTTNTWSHYINAAERIHVGRIGYTGIDSAVDYVTTGSWIHIAVQKTGGLTRFFKNGTATTMYWGGHSGADAYTIGATSADWWSPATSSNPLHIGGGASFGTFYSLNGYMDEIRISNVARYPSNFTPETEPY